MAKKAAQKTGEKNAKKRQSGVKTFVAPKKQKTDKRGKGSDEDTGEEDVDVDADNYVNGNGDDGKEESEDSSDVDDDVPLKKVKNAVVKSKTPGLIPMSQSAGSGKTSVACVSEGEELDDVRNSVTLTEAERLCTVRTSPSMRPTF